MSTEIWVAIIGAIALIIAPAIKHLVQLRESRRQGVRSDDVQTQPGPTVDPHEGWREAIAVLQIRAERAEAALAAERDLRWAAIHYIRRLLDWIAHHLPGHPPPSPPDALVDYLPPRKDQP